MQTAHTQTGMFRDAATAVERVEAFELGRHSLAFRLAAHIGRKYCERRDIEKRVADLGAIVLDQAATIQRLQDELAESVARFERLTRLVHESNG
jgi:hypothetical protein